MSRLAVPVLLCVAGVAVLVALGTWQVRRLVWKEEILAAIDARIGGEPAALPLSPDPVDDLYLPVAVTGTTTGRELHLLVSTRIGGAAWRVVTGLTTQDGRTVLLDRGLLSYDAKDDDRPAGPVSVTGNLHWPQETDSFTPEPQIDDNIWFARDVDRMAAALGTEPVLVVARTIDDDTTSPLPISSEGVPNNHLGYAVTWFGLAAVWAAMSGLWIYRRRSAR